MMASRELCSRYICQRPILSFTTPHCRPRIAPQLLSITLSRHASGSSKSGPAKKDAPKKKKKARTDFKREDLKHAIRFSLCDAMRWVYGVELMIHVYTHLPLRYIRAFEVGRSPTSSKYEVHVALKTIKNGPVIRNRLRLPHAVDTSQRICVICPPDSPIAAAAIKAGATLVGEETVFDTVKDGRIEFERCICHVDSAQAMNKAGLGRILGPKGLMPNAKTGTVVKDVPGTIREMIGGSEYREKQGVVRMAIGQLRFTPEEMKANIKTFIDNLKKDMAQLSDKVDKQIHEVVSPPEICHTARGPRF